MLGTSNYYYDDEESEREVTMPRRANDTFKMIDGPELPMLFDSFWQPAELALLFGHPGVGKSLLAVQIAEAIARGNRILGEGAAEIPPQRVLYVDLVMSARQFAARYSPYEFGPEFYRDTPPFDRDLFEWLIDMVNGFEFKVIVIDDLSMIGHSSDGIRESLQLMHDLRVLSRGFAASILVLADSYPMVFQNASDERVLRRSQILCSVADSTFALTVPPDADKGRRDLVQTRSLSDELIWTAASPLPCTLTQLDGGLTGFRFDPPEIDKELNEKIAAIKQMHDHEGKTFRAIAAELGISKSQAQRLHGL